MPTPNWIRKPTSYLQGRIAGLQQQEAVLEAAHYAAQAKAALEDADRAKELAAIEYEIEALHEEIGRRRSPDPADVAALEDRQTANAGDTGWHNDNAPEG